MWSLAAALREGWEVEGILTDNKRNPIGYMMRRQRFDGKWERAKLLISRPE